MRKFYKQKVLKLYKENWEKIYKQKVLKLYKEVEKILQSKSVETLQRNWEKFTIKKCWNFTMKLRKNSDQKCWNFQNIEPNFTTKSVWLNFMFDKVNKSKIKVSSNVTIPIWTLFESYPKGIVKKEYLPILSWRLYEPWEKKKCEARLMSHKHTC